MSAASPNQGKEFLEPWAVAPGMSGMVTMGQASAEDRSGAQQPQPKELPKPKREKVIVDPMFWTDEEISVELKEAWIKIDRRFLGRLNVYEIRRFLLDRGSEFEDLEAYHELLRYCSRDEKFLPLQDYLQEIAAMAEVDRDVYCITEEEYTSEEEEGDDEERELPPAFGSLDLE